MKSFYDLMSGVFRVSLITVQCAHTNRQRLKVENQRSLKIEIHTGAIKLYQH
jgi:hypothetical protein